MYKHPEQVEYMNDKQKGNVNQLSTSGWCLHAASKYCTKQSTFTEHCSNLAVPNLQLSQWLQLTWAGLHVDVHRLMITGSHRPAKHCRLCQGKSTASNSKHTHNLLSKEDESVKLAFSLSRSSTGGGVTEWIKTLESRSRSCKFEPQTWALNVPQTHPHGGLTA